MAKYRERAKHERTCVVCGKVFLASRPDAKYDAPACRQASKRKATGRVEQPAVKGAKKAVVRQVDQWRRSLKNGDVAYYKGGVMVAIVRVGYSRRIKAWVATMRRTDDTGTYTRLLDNVFGCEVDARNADVK